MTPGTGDPSRRPWLGVAILVGLVYLAVAMVTGSLAAAAASDRMRLIWRWSAFAASGVVFAAHIAYERLRLERGARTTAWHTAAAVAVGGFTLALAANLHDLGSAAGYRPRMLVALVAWPLVTAVPAFVVALAAAAWPGMRRH